MALDIGCVLPAAACAALGATCLAPVCLPAGVVPSGLLAIELAALVPIVCCVFWSPAAALGAFGLAQWVEWDEVDGKFIPVEEDTILFSPEGEALYGEVYCPMSPEEEAAVNADTAETMRRRSLDGGREARGEQAEPVCGPMPAVGNVGGVGSVGGVVLGLSARAASACAAVAGCPAGQEEGSNTTPSDPRQKKTE